MTSVMRMRGPALTRIWFRTGMAVQRHPDKSDISCQSTAAGGLGCLHGASLSPVCLLREGQRQKTGCSTVSYGPLQASGNHGSSYQSSLLLIRSFFIISLLPSCAMR